MIPLRNRRGRGSGRRRWSLRVVAASLVVFAVVSFVGNAAAGAQGEVDDQPYVDVVEIDGPIDEIERDFLLDALARADADGRIAAIVLRLNTPGTLGVDGYALAEKVRDSTVPVITWVGASGASVQGAGVLLVAASLHATMAQGTTIGRINPEDLRTGETLGDTALTEQISSLLPSRSQRGAADYATLGERELSAADALELGIVDDVAPTIGELMVSVDAAAFVLSDGRVAVLDMFDVIPEEARIAEQGALELNVITRFWRIAGLEGFFHKINTPTFGYVLLLLGLAAIVFEFYASSVGISGIIGGVLLAIAFVSMGVLPTNWWAVALIAAAFVLFSVDIQLSNLAVPTFLATALLVVGSIFFTSSGVYRVHWWSIALMVTIVVLFYAIAMTTVVKTRFATPTIGRDALVDKTGVAKTSLVPEGLVDVDGAVWMARSHRGRIDEGECVTVQAIDGLVLEVDREPVTTR